MKGISLIILICIFILNLQAQQLDSLTQALEIAEGPEKVKALNALFRANTNSDPVAALTYARQARDLAEKIDDKEGIGASYNNLGVAYRNQGAVDRALEYYLKSLSNYEALNNHSSIASVKNNIATVYALKRDFAQALQYFTASYEKLLELNELEKLPGALNNLGNVYTELELYDRALDHYNQAYQASAKLDKKFSDPLNNIGNVYFKQGNLQRAAEYYDRALIIERDAENKIALVNTLSNLGTAYAKAKQPVKALTYLNEALELCEAIGAKVYLPAIYKSMAEVHYLQNNHKEAYETLLLYTQVNDHINNEQSSRRIAQMEIALEFQEKENQLELLKEKEVVLEMQSNNARIFVILGLMFLILLVAFGYVYYIFRKSKTEETQNG